MGRSLLVLICACGRIGFDPASGGPLTPDAAADAAMITGRHWINRNDGAPGPIWAPRLTYHASRGTVILYGGEKALMPSAEMWELTDAGWVQLCGPCAPGGRISPQLAYDRGRDRLVLYGGRRGSELADHWEWDGGGWTQISAGALPGPRAGGQLIYDTARSRLVLIGGSPSPADLFEYDGTSWSAAGVMPVELSGAGTQATYDAVGTRTFVLNQGGGFTYDEVWSRSGTAPWMRACSSCIGIVRQDGSLTYDPSTTSLLLINGYDADMSASIAGTWQWREGTVTMVSTLPPARDASGVVLDERRNVIVLYGGNGSSCNGGSDCDETWELVPD